MTESITAQGVVSSVERMSGWAFGDPSYWYDATVQFSDSSGTSHTIRNTRFSGWTPKLGATVTVFYVPGQPEQAKIVEEEVAGERWVLAVAGFFLLIGVLLGILK